MSTSEAVTERRNLIDRRRFTWRTVVYGFFRSRRHDHRRNQDAEVVFLDWHHPWLFFLAIGTMLLSCADAFLTLELLQRGMIEANPVMAAMLEQGVGTFAAGKMALTGIAILMLVYLAKAHFLNRFRTGLFMTMIFSCYACLICYELVHLFRVM